jgi:hypothetical protein
LFSTSFRIGTAGGAGAPPGFYWLIFWWLG